MEFSTIRAGVLNFWLITSSLFLVAIKDAILSVLEIIGVYVGAAVRRRDFVRSGWAEAENEEPNSAAWDHFRGLPNEIRASLAVTSFESVAQNLCQEDETICAVCICEYQSQDPVCLLPFCSHIFHKTCLDQWLDHNQTTCPTCRASLLTQELAQKSQKKEEELMAELAFWFSFHHGSGLMSSPWHISHGFSESAN